MQMTKVNPKSALLLLSASLMATSVVIAYQEAQPARAFNCDAFGCQENSDCGSNCNCKKGTGQTNGNCYLN